MRPVSDRLVGLLEIESAIGDEARTVRNLVPNEPGWDRLVGEASALAEYIRNLLLSGVNLSDGVEALARKPGLGIRPVAIWGPIERIIYRALTRVVMRPIGFPNRDSAAYVAFVKAPISRAFELKKEMGGDATEMARTFFLASPVRYVVKADVTAFYQFIDHDLLRSELIAQGGDQEAAALLAELLGEINGREFGLPQLLDPSDWLSEVYIGRVERHMLRAGFETWHFNDDFRVACGNYEDALAAVELLDKAARLNGLTLNENKTFTYGFWHYLSETVSAEPDTPAAVIATDDVEMLVGDYTDSFEDDLDAAADLLANVPVEDVPSEEGSVNISLKSARARETRILLRALNGLASGTDPRGLSRAIDLVRFVPAMTPAICRYLVACSKIAPDAVAGVAEEARGLALSEWQKTWLLDTYLQLGLLDSGVRGSDARAAWVEVLWASSTDESLRAGAVRLLAASQRWSVGDVVSAASDAPSALLLTYADAAVISSSGTSGTRALEAFRSESVLARLAATSRPSRKRTPRPRGSRS